MSTGSAASDAEDEGARHRRRTLARELEDGGGGVEGGAKQQRRLGGAQQRAARRSQRSAANARERARMRVLSSAFSRLKTSLPWVPADTKLSKLDTLRLASSYISHLRQLLQDDRLDSSFVHPVNLTWPFMMTGRSEDDFTSSVRLCGTTA